MGCDGGTIPTRDELVKLKKKPEKKDKEAELAAKWKHCAITQEPLRSPIVACELGRLYNKESVLEYLLDKTKFESAANFSHIRGLKDVKALNLSDNPAFKKLDNEKGDAYIDTNTSRYICPVVGIEMNGKHKFCFVWSCGCVVSERAIKEIKENVCHKCGAAVTDADIVVLNGTEDDVDEMVMKMDARRLKAKLEKKSKKKKAAESSLSVADEGPSSKQAKLDPQPGTSSSLNGTHPKSKLTNGKKDSKSKLTNNKPEDKLKKDGSIQNDPKASNAFKSLFTTSEAGKKAKTAHWVTMNPLYY
ncbi:unnamed protein product [Owenia fusiformis]|uniref:Replication termination factor 2 n=1 Tax=Owenia fusiformis TaxID=6347 RepID=A0A8J1UX54_OWEFU|nr:unnamed protein product [Owenia fusiformis]